jgi:hypothetical protein
LQFGQGLEKIPACFAEKNQKAKDQKNGENIPSAEQTGPAANRNWDEYAHALGHLSEIAVTKPKSQNRGSQNCREIASAPGRRSRLVSSPNNTGNAWIKRLLARLTKITREHPMPRHDRAS